MGVPVRLFRQGLASFRELTPAAINIVQGAGFAGSWVLGAWDHDCLSTSDGRDFWSLRIHSGALKPDQKRGASRSDGPSDEASMHD